MTGSLSEIAFTWNGYSQRCQHETQCVIASSTYLLLQIPWKEVSVLPLQWQALAFGLFASIIAPFGGFFASGFKRAFKIKAILPLEVP